MERGAANTVLWASALCILWGLVQGAWELFADKPLPGIPASVLVLIGVLAGLIGQVLWRQAIRIEALERRLAERKPEERD